MRRMGVKMIQALIKNNGNGKNIRMMFPATKIELQIARLKIGRTEQKRYTADIYQSWNYSVDDATLEEINCFAERLEIMTLEQQQKLACLSENQNITIKDLINLAYNVDNYDLREGISSEELLGEFVLDGNMDEEYLNLPDEVYRMLDAKKIGRKFREKDGGSISQYGYCCPVNKSTLFYDGINLPVQPPDYVMQVKRNGAELLLPASDEDVQSFCQQIQKTGNKEISIKLFSYKLISLEQLPELNELCRELGNLNDIDLSKFIAVYTANAEDNAQTILESLDQYEYAADPEEYGRQYYEKYCAGSVSSEMLGYVDFNRFGCELMVQTDATATKYGVIQKISQVQKEHTEVPETESELNIGM